jgi:hypothetical protein
MPSATRFMRFSTMRWIKQRDAQRGMKQMVLAGDQPNGPSVQ